jgi:hypothetical protein
MAEQIFAKTLRLILPETANSLNIPAEAPTFISPVTSEPSVCRHCGITYAPLVYQTGQTTVAQHYHAKSGGIYFVCMPSTKRLKALLYTSGFIAFVQPLGPIATERLFTDVVGRSEAVRVIAIQAYCMHSKHYSPHSLDAGILASRPPDPDANLLPGQLIPHCEQLPLTKYRHPRFRFTARDGTICIRMI